MRKYAAMGLAAVLAAASFPAAVLADEADVKRVRIGAPYDPVTMDYAELNVDPATYIDTLISDTLIRSKQGEYIGGAAESWETSEDGKTWTFKLKEGLTYSDGETPITSEDFVYAAKRLMDPEAGHYNAESGYILENGEGDFWRRKAQEVRSKIRDYLWIEEKNACYDRDCDNRFMDVLTHNNLRCMYYGSFDQDMADRFIRFHLLNPDEFWTNVPLPSIAANDPCFTNINFNNWGGQPQGLTYQRAIQALEQYGHVSEIRMLGKKWLYLLRDQKKLVQQYDPFDGTPCVTRSEGLAPAGDETARYEGVATLGPEGYGPTILAALEYISLLCGVNIAFEKAAWSAVRNWPAGTYKQMMYGHTYTLTQDGQNMQAFLDETPVFTCSCGVQVVTSLSGEIISLSGIEETETPVSLYFGGTSYHGTISPNQQVLPENGSFRQIRQIAFDYPYKQE